MPQTEHDKWVAEVFCKRRRLGFWYPEAEAQKEIRPASTNWVVYLKGSNWITDIIRARKITGEDQIIREWQDDIEYTFKSLSDLGVFTKFLDALLTQRFMSLENCSYRGCSWKDGKLVEN